MQWSDLAQEKQKNQLAQTAFRCNKTIATTAAAITLHSLPPHQRCTAAKDSKSQGVHCQMTDAVESNH
jgi:hypothetical protein